MLTLNSLLPVLDEFVYAGLNENLTIVAIDSLTGQLLGACINVIAVKSEKEETLDDYVEKYKVYKNCLGSEPQLV